MTNEIIDKLNGFGVWTLVIMHREQGAGSGDYYDEDWDATYDYALVVSNEEKLHINENLSEWYNWCDSNGINCMVFDESGCVNGIDALIKEAEERDGAKVVKDLRQLMQ